MNTIDFHACIDTGTKKKYKVSLARVEYYSYDYEVEADSEEEADEIALRMYEADEGDGGDLVSAEEFLNGTMEIKE
jgi:4-aminobutyrate aminotransferase-like enzyme